VKGLLVEVDDKTGAVRTLRPLPAWGAQLTDQK
jgi:hypothetical protein